MLNTITQPAREIDVLGEYDVVVAGGGPAGVCAGLAAARAGARTLLVEQFHCLGGMATAGLHQHLGVYMGEGGRGEIVGGVVREIAQRAAREGGGAFVGCYLDVEIEGFKRQLDDMAAEAGLDVLLYSLVTDVIVRDGAVGGVILSTKSGPLAALVARVVDGTGDADLAFLAGCPVVKGRAQDARMQPGTLMFRVGGVDIEKVREDQKPRWDIPQFCEEATRRGLMGPWQTKLMGFWWVPARPDQLGVNFTHMHVDGTEVRDLTRAAVEGRRQVEEAVRAMRGVIPGCEDAYLIDTATQIGIRETRRIVGEYTITQDDIREMRIFDDSIGLGSAFVDIHNVEGPGMDKRSGLHLPPGGYYSIPYRTLLPCEVEGLLVAGRCHSATHEAAGSTRWMAQCMVMGEAAGTAAALSLERGVMPRDLEVAALQGALTAQGAILR